MDSMGNGKIILVKCWKTDRYLHRHPNDIKLYQGSIAEPLEQRAYSDTDVLRAWREAFASIDIDNNGM